MRPPYDQLLESALNALSAIAPGAIGSLVSQFYEWDPELSMRQRVAQWIAGIAVSYYVGLGLKVLAGWDGVGAQSVQFVLGLIAFKAAPRFIEKASEVIGNLPQDVRDWILRRKGDSQ